jgi:hypothetical protein
MADDSYRSGRSLYTLPKLWFEAHHQERRLLNEHRSVRDVTFGNGSSTQSLLSSGEDAYARLSVTAHLVSGSGARDSRVLLSHDCRIPLSAPKTVVNSVSEHLSGMDDRWLGDRFALGIERGQGTRIGETIMTRADHNFRACIAGQGS